MFIAKKGELKLFIELTHYDEVKWSGGAHRSYQLFEIFKSRGFTMIPLDKIVRPARWKMLGWAIAAIIRFGIYKPLSVQSLRSGGYTYFKFSALSRQFPEISIYFIEGVGFGAIQAVSILKFLGKKVILAPNNIEALVPYTHTWTHRLSLLDRLNEEVKYYNFADAVFCISLEEVWLLSIAGANVFFLPYYPPEILLKKILKRREARKASKKKDLFYYANFENIPNYLGFKDFIDDKLYLERRIKVAGLGIAKIVSLIEGKQEFIILGELSDDELEKQLIECEKVILNHFPTSGMLTRIPELLLSGITVIGNDAALKAYSMIPQGDAENLYRHLKDQATQGSNNLISFIQAIP